MACPKARDPGVRVRRCGTVARAADLGDVGRGVWHCAGWRARTNLGGRTSGEGSRSDLIWTVSFHGAPVLHVGSTIIGIGFAIAASHLLVAALVGLYLAATLAAAMRREQSFLERTFGDRYQAYRSGRDLDQAKRFSVDRARRNREYRAVAGFVAVALVLAAKAAMR